MQSLQYDNRDEASRFLGTVCTGFCVQTVCMKSTKSTRASRCAQYFQSLALLLQKLRRALLEWCKIAVAVQGETRAVIGLTREWLSVCPIF